VPALILDPAARERLAASPRRAAFFCGAAASLARELETRHARLIVRRGPLAATVKRLARETDAGAVFWAASYDAAGVQRDRSLQSALEEAGFEARALHDAPAVAPEDTADARRTDAGAGYRSFASYLPMWRRVERPVYDRRLLFADPGVAGEGLPVCEEFDSTLPAQDAGERQALARFEQFLAEPILRYAAGRFAPAADGTSRLSADLSFGTIAARTIVRRVEERAADRFLLEEERQSIALFLRSIARRDFFFQLAWFFEERADEALQRRMRDFPFARAHRLLDAWREGRTGFPLVDAGMRELRATGWMHPHARMVAASFLCFDLGVDWRVGRDLWDRELVEDDPAIAGGNWQWIAGVGADLAQYPRIYNPIAQARRFDPLGVYARRWIPDLPASPPVRDGGRQTVLPLFGEQTYPAPVLDHASAARAFLERYAAFAGAGSKRP
jgi:deoxyribodipyrimidine photo-lyase